MCQRPRDGICAACERIAAGGGNDPGAHRGQVGWGPTLRDLSRVRSTRGLRQGSDRSCWARRAGCVSRKSSARHVREGIGGARWGSASLGDDRSVMSCGRAGGERVIRWSYRQPSLEEHDPAGVVDRREQVPRATSGTGPAALFRRWRDRPRLALGDAVRALGRRGAARVAAGEPRSGDRIDRLQGARIVVTRRNRARRAGPAPTGSHGPSAIAV